MARPDARPGQGRAGTPPQAVEWPAVARLMGIALLTLGLALASGAVLSEEAPAGQPAPAPGGESLTPLAGRTVFLAKGCAVCHSAPGVTGHVRVGPDLTALPSVAAGRRPGMSAEAYVRESIVAPQAFVVSGYGQGAGSGSVMPVLQINPPELDALVDYLLTTPA